MNAIVAASLFENPWVIAVILIVAGLANWLTQRRQQKQQEEQERQAEDAVRGAPAKPQRDFDVEETLRRLLGEELQPPRPVPGPVRPPIKPSSTEDDGFIQLPPVLAPPPIIPVPPAAKAIEAARQVEAAAMPAGSVVVAGERRPARRSRARMRYGWNWRDPNRARQAFVASLVFGPPRGLEP
jgi:hypothetical protein